MAYLAACEYLDIIPQSSFLSQIAAKTDTIVLKHDRIGPKGAQAVAEALCFSETVTCVEMGHCAIQAGGAIAILDAARHTPSPDGITELRLEGNRIGEGEYLSVVEGDTPSALHDAREQAKKMAKLKALRGKKEKQQKKEEPTEEELAERKKLQDWEDGLARLDVFRRSAPAATALKALLNDTSTLKVLRLGWNGVTDAFIAELADVAWDVAPLMEVGFEHNKLTDASADTIAAAVSISPMISLDLSANKFGPAIATKLAEALDQMSLTHLNLSGNSLGDGAAPLLAGLAAGGQTFLTSLSISETALGPRSVSEFIKLIQADTGLEMIDVSGNQMGSADDRQAIVDAVVGGSGGPKTIIMEGVPFTREQRAALGAVQGKEIRVERRLGRRR